jgi:hypothetical protein
MWMVGLILGLGLACSEAAKEDLNKDGLGADQYGNDQQNLDGFLGGDEAEPLDQVATDGGLDSAEPGDLGTQDYHTEGVFEDADRVDLTEVGSDTFWDDTSAPDVALEDTVLQDTVFFEDTMQGSKCAPVGNLGWKRMDGIQTWAVAKAACEEDSKRLPNICELRSLVQGCANTEVTGSCGITTECTDFCYNGELCLGCALDSGPGVNGCYLSEDGPCGYYWSGTPHGSWPKEAWLINFDTAHVFSGGTSSKANFFCVN